MTTYTLVGFGRGLSDAEDTSHRQYLIDQMALGNTDGVAIQVSKVGLETLPGFLLRRSWATPESAEAYIAFCKSMDPKPLFAESHTEGDAFIISPQPGEPLGPHTPPA